MSGPFDWEQTDKQIGKLLDEGKCLMCRGSGRDRVYSHSEGQWVEDDCSYCNGTGYYQGEDNDGEE